MNRRNKEKSKRALKGKKNKKFKEEYTMKLKDMKEEVEGKRKRKRGRKPKQILEGIFSKNDSKKYIKHFLDKNEKLEESEFNEKIYALWVFLHQICEKEDDVGKIS